jgi:hypothetical protein
MHLRCLAKRTGGAGPYSLKRKLKQYFRLYLIDEYRTSFLQTGSADSLRGIFDAYIIIYLFSKFASQMPREASRRSRFGQKKIKKTIINSKKLKNTFDSCI